MASCIESGIVRFSLDLPPAADAACQRVIAVFIDGSLDHRHALAGDCQHLPVVWAPRNALVRIEVRDGEAPPLVCAFPAVPPEMVQSGEICVRFL